MNALKRTALIQEFEEYLKGSVLSFKKEVVFSSIMNTKRKFRADYFIEFPNYYKNCIIEINGGQWSNGRHNRGGKGYENDLTKLNLAQKNGFRIFQFTYEMLERQEYKEYL